MTLWKPAALSLFMAACLGCASVRDEVASGVNLYNHGYDVYIEVCKSTTKEDYQWCVDYFKAMRDLKKALVMIDGAVKLGGNMKYQSAALKESMAAVKGFVDASADRITARAIRKSSWARTPPENFRRTRGFVPDLRRSDSASTRRAAAVDTPRRDKTPWLI